jgi:hypothetical protein
LLVFIGEACRDAFDPGAEMSDNLIEIRDLRVAFGEQKWCTA